MPTPAISFAVWILCILCAMLTGCDSFSDGEDPLEVDMSVRETLGGHVEPEGITYAYLPQYSHTVSYRRHRLMVQYLSQTTGLAIRQVFPDTFDEHLEMVNRGLIDISFSNPFIYITLAQSGARAFARVVESKGESDFWGQIICRADNEAIRTLDDCRGKRWIAVDPGSAGGYLFPLGYFKRHGIEPEDFAEIAFAPGPGGKQEKVVLAVAAGAYDIGSIRTGTLDIVKNKINRDDIRVLAETSRYPGWVYAARSGIEQDVVDKIGEALFALDPNKPAHKAILNHAAFEGVIPAEDADYDPVRQLASELGIE